MTTASEGDNGTRRMRRYEQPKVQLDMPDVWHGLCLGACAVTYRLLGFAPDSDQKFQPDQHFEIALRVAEFMLSNRVSKVQDLIELPKHLLSSATTIAALIDETYGRLDASESEAQQIRLLKHAILTPKNADVRSVNSVAIEKLAGTGTTYESINSVVDERHACHYTEEYLQSLEINNFPAHKLQLKIGAPIMVLRNIDPLNGVCNGTKGIVTRLLPHLLEMETSDVDGNRKKVLIHRISLTPSDAQIPIKFQRRQFPVALCFAMTINKSQGQTLEKVGLYLPKPVFGHGQLYVALSRVTHPDNIKILVENTEQHGINKSKASKRKRSDKEEMDYDSDDSLYN